MQNFEHFFGEAPSDTMLFLLIAAIIEGDCSQQKK